MKYLKDNYIMYQFGSKPLIARDFLAEDLIAYPFIVINPQKLDL
jgi:hypothetical protein